MRAGWIAIGLVAAACGGDGGGPTTPSPPPVPLGPPGKPTLLAPAMDAVIPQNDPTSGCAFNPRLGYGNRIPFDWTDVSADAGVAGYDIVVQGATAIIPIVNTRAPSSDYLHRDCNGFVVDRLSQGWMWRVRAVDRTGQVGEWAEGRYNYGPCRVDGRLCGS